MRVIYAFVTSNAAWAFMRDCDDAFVAADVIVGFPGLLDHTVEAVVESRGAAVCVEALAEKRGGLLKEARS